MHVALIPELIQDSVEILDEQDELLTALRAEILKRREGVSGEPFCITLLLFEIVRLFLPTCVLDGVCQVAKCGQPETRQIAYAVAFLVERHRLPL